VIEEEDSSIDPNIQGEIFTLDGMLNIDLASLYVFTIMGEDAWQSVDV
jgi:hypothetical protein